MTGDYTRSIDARGIIAGSDWLRLPVTLYSQTGNFYRRVEDGEQLLQFLRDHRKTPGANFNVEEVHAYYREQPGDVIYSASEFHIRSEHDTRGLLPGYEGLY